MADRGTDVPSIAAALRISDKTVYRVLDKLRTQEEELEGPVRATG